MRERRIERLLAGTVLALGLVGGAGGISGCSKQERDARTLKGGDAMDDKKALGLLAAAETSGKLDGIEIEHYVAGGLPPPHYRSEQFRLFVHEGRDTLRFVTPDFQAHHEGTAYPNHTYDLPATPADVRTIARLVRESGAFAKAVPVDEPAGAPDRMRTELAVILHGKEAKRVYVGAEPPELTKLRAVIQPMIARLKAQGAHRVMP